MQVVILAAGEGVRMGNLTKNRPKPMLPIKNQPKLVYTLKALPEEIDEVIFVVRYLKEQIMDYFGKEYAGRKIKYLVQPELNGSAGAVNLAKDLIQEKFLVLMGDDLYLKSDLEKLLSYPQSILVYKTDQADQFGLVAVDKENCLLDVVERPHGKKKGLVNTGAYVLSKEYFNMNPIAVSKTEYGLPQTLVSMYPEYKTKIIEATKWQPIGCPEDLIIANDRIDKFI